MKRFALSTIILVSILSLWQWYRLHSLERRRTVLVAQITEAKTVLAAKRLPAQQSAAVNQAAPDSTAVAARPLSIEEFFDLAATISQLEGKTGPDSRREMEAMVQSLFSRLAVTPIDRLAGIMDQLAFRGVSVTGQRQVATVIMGLLSKADPRAAVGHAVQSTTGSHALGVALRAWARQDAAGAAAWLDRTVADGSLPPGVDSQALRDGLLPRLIAADPAGARLDELARVNPAALDDVLAETVRLLTTEDARQAFFLRLTGESSLATGASVEFLRQVARETSVDAATTLLNATGKSLPAAQFNALATAAATSRIDAATPMQADWLLRNVRGEDREPAIAEFMQAWTKADFNGAARWLRDQPASSDHDSAIAAFAPMVAATEPPSAVDWAVAISNGPRRQQVLDELYADWHARAPEEADDYFERKRLARPAARR